MKLLAVATMLAVTMSATPALANDRAPTADERTAIEEKLQSLGYVSWEEIELDDDSPRHAAKWEIDDARKANGERYDVELEPETLRVLEEDLDD